MHPTYKPLDALKSEIRLLRFITDVNGNIAATLRTVALSPSSSSSFTALSYVCGDPTVTETVLLEGEPLEITVNLANALRHVTKHWEAQFPGRDGASFELWADAICINQSDVQERNHQIEFMAKIYQSAELVLSFLGVDDRLTNLALDTYELIANEASQLSVDELLGMHWIEKNASLCDDTWARDDPEVYFHNERWHTMDKFLELEYWSRVWIFQETALARNLVICTETRATHWSSLERAWTSLQLLKEGIRVKQISCPDFLLGTSIWNLLCSDFANWTTLQKIHAGRARAVQIAGDDVVASDGLLMSLMGRGLRATDKKDHIYGLMSLSRVPVTPDYSKSKSVGDVYRDYVSALLDAYPACATELGLPPLFFLFYAGQGLYDHADGFPSWAPNYPEESSKSIAGAMPEGADADHDVFEPDTPMALVSGSDLVVTGLTVESITRVERAPHEDTWLDGSMLKFFEDIVARDKARADMSYMPPLQRIQRTLRLDSTDFVDEPYVFYSFHLLEFLMGTSGDVEHMDQHLQALGLEPLGSDSGSCTFDRSFIEAFFPNYSGPNHAWRDNFGNGAFCDRSERAAVIFDMTLLRKRWRFFETESGLVGLGPLNAKPGDRVCILHGSSFPVVIRHEGSTLSHVGICFVIGLMRGEAAELRRSGARKVEVMRLV
ncbi:HET-domain-containing protein [Coniochaeta ligniaria NRRL 30616]|uniref:HET-domain-containing protein n=1 Tax=Coniochaeta ligniaria NRRL 30616 TaxID=1408157 RepID=A0A1J7JMW1_9PEZI|nr:HET-domain-containing protein [Coniochaeta ligniaria NRRL 30616]